MSTRRCTENAFYSLFDKAKIEVAQVDGRKEENTNKPDQDQNI
jgi:hypothetical protein